MEKRERPKITRGETHRVATGCGKMYITPAWGKDYLVEVFATLGKAGSCAHCQLEALTRSVSLGLRYGIPVEEYVRQLKDIKCPSPTWDDGVQVLSCSDAIAKILEGTYKE